MPELSISDAEIMELLADMHESCKEIFKDPI
jgi:hypothetical protein